MANLDIPIFAKTYGLYKIYSQYLLVFPKTKRYTLGSVIDQNLLYVIELIIEAGYLPRPDKLPTLQKISMKIDLLKILLRLAWETKCIDDKKYQDLSLSLIEIGRMLGGWIKTIKSSG